MAAGPGRPVRVHLVPGTGQENPVPDETDLTKIADRMFNPPPAPGVYTDDSWPT